MSFAALFICFYLNLINPQTLQFVEHYPKRRPPFLAPRNECGVEKFLCTTLRPSQLPFTELYDWERCARFVADFLRYDPLEDPLAYPAHVPSPWSVFQVRFNMDYLLVLSLLSSISLFAKDAARAQRPARTCPLHGRLLMMYLFVSQIKWIFGYVFAFFHATTRS
jgi:hypothetical protein